MEKLYRIKRKDTPDYDDYSEFVIRAINVNEALKILWDAFPPKDYPYLVASNLRTTLIDDTEKILSAYYNQG